MRALYRTFAYTHFREKASHMMALGPSFITKEQFVVQGGSQKQEYCLHPETSQLFNQTFPKKKFCFYHVTHYLKDEWLFIEYRLAIKHNGFYETMRYTFYINQRSYDCDKSDEISAFFIQTVDELPENRLLVITHAIPVRNQLS